MFLLRSSKKLCERANVNYQTKEIGVDISKEDFTKLYPHVIGSPFIMIDGNEIGTLVDLAKHFLKEGLVSVNKLSLIHISEPTRPY